VHPSQARPGLLFRLRPPVFGGPGRDMFNTGPPLKKPRMNFKIRHLKKGLRLATCTRSSVIHRGFADGNFLWRCQLIWACERPKRAR
jgi:hypothetical protein